MSYQIKFHQPLSFILSSSLCIVPVNKVHAKIKSRQNKLISVKTNLRNKLANLDEHLQSLLLLSKCFGDCEQKYYDLAFVSEPF